MVKWSGVSTWCTTEARFMVESLSPTRQAQKDKPLSFVAHAEYTSQRRGTFETNQNPNSYRKKAIRSCKRH
ncbi:hypothetical protein TNCV_1692661 [Trichonephila clavipes]|nr:hypothetical protein TNCV_1692661 [Trichonephila clavipes]